jgi:autotransporter passenger strand-loop-strand repeat protein
MLRSPHRGPLCHAFEIRLVQAHHDEEGRPTMTTVTSGQTLPDFTVSAGNSLIVASGGSAVSTTLDSGGGIFVQSGGTGISTLISSGASNTVGVGAIIIATQVDAGAIEYLLSGAKDTGTVLSSGGNGEHGAGATYGGGGWLQVLSGGTVGGSVDFATGGGIVQLGGTALPGVPISGFGAGDKIDLTNIAYDPTAATPIYDAQSDELQFAENGTPYALSLLAPGNYAGETFLLSSFDTSGTEITVTCFAPGTRIATPSGEVAVEDLRAGDPVLTASGRVRPVRWLAVHTIAARFADPLHAWPIRISAGALGDNRPARDLLLSPGHALLLDGVLVQAGALVNGTSIVRAVRVPERLCYYHLELDTHDLLLAEGVPAESFLEGAEIVPLGNIADRTPPEAPTELPYPRVRSARQVPATLRARLAFGVSLAA